MNYSLPDQAEAEPLARFVVAVRSAFREYEPTKILEGLAPEMAKFYERRDEAVVRLEEALARMVRDNLEYRRQLDAQAEEERNRIRSESDEERNALRKSYKEKEGQLEAEYTTKDEVLQLREGKLKEREQKLDDLSNTDARRKLHQELKKALKERSAKFSLTSETERKRRPIHMAFIALLATIFMMGLYYFTQEATSGETLSVVSVLRLAGSAAAFLVAMLFYIRWQERWAQAHADEEFRLKRLDLDIDRASWFVEMMLEWKEEKGAEIPGALVDTLARGLFEQSSDREPTRHPSEDLAAALFSAASGIRVNVPGLGEVNLDRKSLHKFAKSAQKEGDAP